MQPKKKEHPKEKSRLHIRNQHRQRYDFKLLIESCAELAPFVKVNNYGDESIVFFNPDAVKALNKALLKRYYDIEYWDIPENYLCPPIPGRADYLHYVADLLSSNNNGKIPTGSKIKCLDIGVGANCVYPIIGAKEYGWSFVGSDIDPIALTAAAKIVDSNTALKDKVELRLQSSAKNIFKDLIKQDEYFDVTICNPPFHTSFAKAQEGTLRKLNNLNAEVTAKPVLNFGGQGGELWCFGGEEKFISDMIRESATYSHNCLWFSTLVAKQEHLQSIYGALKKVNPVIVKTIPMGQGNKISRIVAWTFFTKEEKDKWVAVRWIEVDPY